MDRQIQIGVARGSVVGGVIGRQRLLFRSLGDTVNLASRMESSGDAGTDPGRPVDARPPRR